MILELLAAVTAALNILFAIVYCVAGDKNRHFIASIALTILLGCFGLLHGHLSKYILIILPIFTASDVLIYYFSSATPTVHVSTKPTKSTNVYYAFCLWIISITVLGLLYKFIFSTEGSWLSSEQMRPAIEFSHIGELLWDKYFFITVLLTGLMMAAGMGAMLMVRSKE